MTLLNWPFYGGGALDEVEGIYGGAPTASRPFPHTVNLHGVDFPVELFGRDFQYRRGSLDTLRDGVVTSNQPDDSQFNNDGAWWRYAYSWEHGAGQDVQDFGTEFDPLRFKESLGIDPWDEFGAKLHKATTEVRAVTNGNAELVTNGTYVYVADGTAVHRSSDLSTWDAITGLSGTINHLATDGRDVYIATTAHVYRVTNAGLAATVVTADTDDYQIVEFVSNRLIAASDNVLYEIASGGARTVIETHFQAAFRWTAIFNVGSRIYIGGFAGNRSELYSVTTDPLGVLVQSAEAAPFAFNEILRHAISYGGAVVLGTSLGVRFATLGGDGSLTYGPLISSPGNVTALAAEGRFCWFTWEDLPNGASGLGRLALDTTVAPLQPAYATDVYASGATGDVVGIVRFNDRTVFSVASDGVYAEGTNYVENGYLLSGDIYLGTIERKGLSSLSVRTDELSANKSVTAEVTDELGNDLGTYTVSGVGVYGSDMQLDGESIAWARVKITLDSNSTTATPILRRWRLRGYPIAPVTEEWIVPLIIKSHVIVNDGQGQIKSFDTLAEVERLIKACKEKAIVPYREGLRTYRVRIDRYEFRAQEWLDTSDFFEGIMIVRLLSV